MKSNIFEDFIPRSLKNLKSSDIIWRETNGMVKTDDAVKPKNMQHLYDVTIRHLNI